MDKKPTPRRANPLGQVQKIVPDGAAGAHDPSISKSAVETFNTQAGSLKRGMESSETSSAPSDVKSIRLKEALQKSNLTPEEARELLSGGEGVPAEVASGDAHRHFSLEQLGELQEYMMLMDSQDLALARDKNRLKWMRDALARNQELEKRLEPIRLVDFVLREYVTQNVPLVPGELEIRFRTMTPEQNLLMRELVMAAVRELSPEAQADVDMTSGVQQLYELAFMAEDMMGKQPWPVAAGELHRLAHQEGERAKVREELGAAVRQNVGYWKKKPTVWVGQLASHLLSFNLRMRQQLDTVGLQVAVGE